MRDKQNNNSRNLKLISSVIVLIMFVVSIYAWTQIPAGEKICTHWNAAGKCNDYGSKFVGIFLIPIIAAGMAGLFPLLLRIDPRAANIARSRKAYTTVCVTILLFFMVLHCFLILNILGSGININLYLPLLVGLMLIVIGSYLGKIRSNYFFGIRTPWTLSSELSWNKTHRLGSKLMILQGIICIVGKIFFPSEVWVYLLLSSTLVIGIIITTYSYFIWKSDSNVHTF